MKAYVEVKLAERKWWFWKRCRKQRYSLHHVYLGDMDKLLDGPSAPLVGVPMVFDSLRRVWPIPSPGFVVRFET